MKKIFYLLVAFATITSCATVDTGKEAALVSWGGKTNMDYTLKEGVHWGLNFIFDDVVPYEVREQTEEFSATLNDKNDMVTPVEVVVYYQPIRDKVNKLHSSVGTDYVENKLLPLVKSVVGKVIPQYSAQEINKFKRVEVENKITELLKQDAQDIYVNIPRVQFTKVGIPSEVARLAEQTAVQLGKNELAEKKEAEQIALAKAKVAEAEGEYQAGILKAKTRDLLSQPKMIELQRIENERLMWEGFKQHGKSPFGENNIFGNSNPTLLLNRK